MKKGEYKNYATCPICGNTFPRTKAWFRRVNASGDKAFHKICRACEDVIKFNKEWKDGKLLCHKCGEYKKVEEFTKNGGMSKIRGYRRNVCKECTVEARKSATKKWTKEQTLVRCLNSRLLGAKDRAEKRKIEFNLTLDFLLNLWDQQNGKCALSDVQMTYDMLSGRTPTNISIDKINRNLGYTKDNVQLVCMACNQMKSDLSDDMLYFFCKQITLKKERNEK